MNNSQKKLFKRFLYLNTVAFPFFAIVTGVIVVLEAVTYPGFIHGHLFLDPQIFFALLVISGYLVVVNMVTIEKTKYFELLSKLTTLFLPALILVGAIFISLERQHYKGYVYTHGYHFDPSYFFYLFAISLLIFLIDTATRKGLFGKYKLHELPRVFLSLLITSLFVYLIFMNLSSDFYDIKPKLSAVIKHPFADKVWKGRYLFADFYDYMLFVDNNTPSDAVIMRMTQQSKWPGLSNDGYVRSFIYPRFTKAGDENSLNDPRISYVFIHRAYGPPRVVKYIEN